MRMRLLPNELVVSAKTGQGISELWQNIKSILERDFGNHDGGVITRERYRIALRECITHLRRALVMQEPELKAEDLRMAARSLGRITGRIDAEDLLDVIFSSFCIGK